MAVTDDNDNLMMMILIVGKSSSVWGSLYGVAHDGKIDETNDAWWDLIIS